MEKIAIFSQQVAISQKQCEMGPRLLLITTRKSDTGLTGTKINDLNDLERQNRFYGFLAISGCDTHFKSELCRNHYR